MGRPQEPVEIVMAKGRKHLTKEEIETRKNGEVKAPADNVLPPGYLNKKQKTEFKKIAKELLEINIISNLDCDLLARFLIAKDKYVRFSKLLDSNLSIVEELQKNENQEGTIEKFNKCLGLIDTYLSWQDKAFKQCQTCASALGLTISSRCKLVVPKPEAPKENKFSKFQKSGVG